MSNQLHEAPKTLRIEQKQFIFEYEIPNIVYIESFGKHIVIYTRKDEKSFIEDTISGYSLSKVLKLLGDDFVQCHKSYIVNRAHITKIDKQGMKLSLKQSDGAIPVGEKFKECVWE
jgi:two-component system LytT family response regulator